MKNVKKRQRGRDGWNKVGWYLRSRQHDLRWFGGNVFRSAFVIGRTRGSRLFQDAALRNQGWLIALISPSPRVSTRCRKESRNTRTFPIIIFRDFAVGRRGEGVWKLLRKRTTAWGWIGGDSAARSRTFDNGAGSTFRPEKRRNFRGWCALYNWSVDTSWPFVHTPCTTCTRILFHSE